MKFRYRITILAGIFMCLEQAAAQSKYCSGPDEYAFNGNDLTSYFSGELVKGHLQHVLKYDGLNLLFASAANKQAFEADPGRFMPAYNGYCAIALAKGSLSRPDFDNFKVQDGELLFFGVMGFYNMRTDWEKDPIGNKNLADDYYKSFFPNNSVEDKLAAPRADTLHGESPQMNSSRRSLGGWLFGMLLILFAGGISLRIVSR